jgi:hypothetical protein
MSLTNKFTKLTTGQQTGGENTDINMNTLQIPDSSQNTSAPPSGIQTSVIDKTHRKSKQPKKNVFTFVTVYYKCGVWHTLVYDTLREALLEIVGRHDLTEQETLGLVSMDDDGLLYEMLIMGTNSGMYISDLAHRYNCESQAKKISRCKEAKDS